MASKDKLSDMLNKLNIKRGQGVRLSTEGESKQPVQENSAITHNRTNAQSHRESVKRVNRGYKLREDLIRGCKQVALDTSRPLYEIMEDALSEYLKARRTNAHSH